MNTEIFITFGEERNYDQWPSNQIRVVANIKFDDLISTSDNDESVMTSMSELFRRIVIPHVGDEPTSKAIKSFWRRRVLTILIGRTYGKILCISRKVCIVNEVTGNLVDWLSLHESGRIWLYRWVRPGVRAECSQTLVFVQNSFSGLGSATSGWQDWSATFGSQNLTAKIALFAITQSIASWICFRTHLSRETCENPSQRQPTSIAFSRNTVSCRCATVRFTNYMLCGTVRWLFERIIRMLLATHV